MRIDQRIVANRFLKNGAAVFDDMVIRLEPGDEHLATAIGHVDTAKADEGVHLVDIAANGFLPSCRLHDIGIGGDVQQARLSAQPPEKSIEQGKALGMAVADRVSREVEKGAGVREG